MNDRMLWVCVLFLSTVTTARAATVAAYVEGGLFGQQTAGGVNQSYAYVQGDPASPDYFQAEASFDPGALTPLLRAEAHNANPALDTDKYINAAANVYQTYQFTGAAPQDLVIDLILHGVIAKQFSSSYIDADFMVYRGTQLSGTYCPGKTYLDAFQQYACNGILGEGFGYHSIELFNDGDQTLTDQIVFSVNPGDTFLIYARLNALTFGGAADAFHSLSATFNDVSNIKVLGAVPTPAPGTAWLFGVGLLALVAVAVRPGVMKTPG